MKRILRMGSWVIVAILIVVATYIFFDATHAFYKFSLAGTRFFDQERYSEALPYLLASYRINPQDKSIAWELIWTYDHLNREAEGRRILEEVNARFPTDPKISESLGDMAYSMKAYNLAQRDYDRVLARKPSASVRKKYVEVLLAQKKYADALNQMEVLLSKAPDDLDLQFQHARVIAAMGDHERAVRELQVLLNNGFNKKEVVTSLADELRLAGREDEAIKVYQEVVNAI